MLSEANKTFKIYTERRLTIKNQIPLSNLPQRNPVTMIPQEKLLHDSIAFTYKPPKS